MVIINYKLYGENKQSAIIFLHGWAGDYNNFLSSALTLADRCIVVNTSLFDVAPNAPLQLGDYCDFVRNIIDKLRNDYGAKFITLVGHSFGGRVAIRLASEGMANRIVLVDSAGLKPHRTIKHIARRLKHRIYRLLRINSIKLGSPDYRALSPVMKRTFVNIVNCYQEQDAAKISIPTLIVWGNRDKDTPPYMARKLHRLIADSAIIMLKGGHYSYLDEYGKFMAIITCFAVLKQ